MKITADANICSDGRGTEEVIALADCLYEGKGFVQDKGAALSLYMEAAKHASPEGMFKAGRIFTECGDEKRGLIYIKKAASSGYAPAMSYLGEYHLKRGNTEDAKTCFIPAAQAGDPDAFLGLGNISEAENDMTGAAEQYRKAYDEGIKDAALCLGRVYEKQNNPDLALYWYRQAEDEKSCERIRSGLTDIEVEIEYEDNL